jgi:hypothetical protein
MLRLAGFSISTNSSVLRTKGHENEARAIGVGTVFFRDFGPGYPLFGCGGTQIC